MTTEEMAAKLEADCELLANRVGLSILEWGPIANRMLDVAARLRAMDGMLSRLDATAKHVTHYAYGRTPDEQLGQVAFQVLEQYRTARGGT